MLLMRVCPFGVLRDFYGIKPMYLKRSIYACSVYALLCYPSSSFSIYYCVALDNTGTVLLFLYCFNT